MPNYFVTFSGGEKFQIGTIEGISAQDAIALWPADHPKVEEIVSVQDGVRYVAVNVGTNIVESEGVNIVAGDNQFLIESVDAQIGQTFSNGIFT